MTGELLHVRSYLNPSFVFSSPVLQMVEVGVDGNTGRLKYITKDGKLSLKVDQNFFWYNSSNGNNTNSTQPSGAYIFR